MRVLLSLALLFACGVVSLNCSGGSRQLYLQNTPPPQPPPPPPPTSWNDTATFSTLSVLGHHFHTALVRNGSPQANTQCTLFFRIKFTSPTSYYHRFQAKITMSGGAWVRTRAFFNQGYGERVYRFNYDTSAQGCWAQRYHRITYLTVHGCTGYGCYVRPIP